MSNLYNVVLPTSLQPLDGWSAGDRCVFLINFPNREIRRGSVRLNGFLQLFGNGAAIPAGMVKLNENAGVSGFIRQIQVKFGSSNVETLNEYGRFVAMKNQATYYQYDNCCTSDSMLELMTYSNDSNKTDTFKKNITQGLKFAPDAGSSELPFSIDLDCCVNCSDVNIPFSKTAEIEIAIIFQDTVKCGMLATDGVAITYALQNLELRYMSDVEQEHMGSLVLETKCNAHIPTIINKISSLEFSPSNAFDSVVCSFLKTSSNSTSNSFTFDYLATEAITQLVEYLEVKINGTDNVLRYPLRFQTAEILYNYLLAFKPLIHENDTSEVKKHGLTYSSLAAGTGYGVGCNFYSGLDAGTNVCFNISLRTPPSPDNYRCFFYTIGKLIL